MVLLSRTIYLNPVMTPKEFEMMMIVALSGMSLVMLLMIVVMGLSTATCLRDKPGDNGVEVGIPADGDTPGATTSETGIALGGPRGPEAVPVRTMDGTTAWSGRGSASSGSGSADGSGYDKDSKDSTADPWGRFVSGSDSRGHQDAPQPGGWGPATDAQGKGYRGKPFEGSRGPSEKMIVPSFSGKAGENEDIGTTARSYLRQVSAWRRMTRMTEDQQGLTLYQHLTDKAWVDAERLDVDRLASKDGVEYLLEWIKDRYLDVEVTQIGRSLSGFFRGLHRKANQSVRDYMAEFDRAFARLGEVGCHLPDVAAAWVFVDRMGLEEQAELNLLASVGNQYSLKALQQAAIVHDRGLRKPWESGSRAPRKEWTTKRPFTANMAGINEEADYENEDGFILDEDSQDYVSEEMAENLYQAFMTHETAKAKYRESMKLRGSDPNSLK